jgi:UDP-N-acetylglucosamine 2-epimerase
VGGVTKEMTKGVAVVLGTRPEIIKLAELIRLLGDDARIVYTGQHYDDGLASAFFRELGIPDPDVVLAVGGTPRGHQIGEAVKLLDRHFAQQPPQAVLVQGDTNATLVGRSPRTRAKCRSCVSSGRCRFPWSFHSIRAPPPAWTRSDSPTCCARSR